MDTRLQAIAWSGTSGIINSPLGDGIDGGEDEMGVVYSSPAVMTTEGSTMCDKRTEWQGVAENKTKMSMKMERKPEE
ncbi:hypothetical protein PABG_12036 [Paracoccidioides brasiliensis Pb03]|uniref:Uncharacterized protein n=2 Tax=Paracoccidioides brasiliensis TaxID=121759 RepID=C1GE68_PARBD|nr:uncharacterized protein PADG_05554 [Paracoccidioides brasiliensis Pb18]EEH49475.1 hypothetical protein PADG_05554 [Paracoccidioides brasiliensis Pb18]KGY15088.1 hypothetical protein PABG_12036 [Paracoccidioides brasiliensis Pb03]ODH53071.1 hypothetical protein GX48_00605 [Paracoccidioides brasiliensis]